MNAFNEAPQAHIGDTVKVRSAAGNIFTAVVEYVDTDIKNRRPGYDLDNDTWCYNDQVIRIIRRA